MLRSTLFIAFCSLIITAANATKSSDTLSVQDIVALKIKAKELFAQRDKKEKLEEGIKIMEEILAKESDYETMVLLSHSYYFFAEFHDDKIRKLELHEKGLNAGEMALGKIEKFAQAMKGGAKEEDAVKILTKENIEALYWTAANLARWAKYSSFSKRVAAKSRIRYLWDKIHEIDATYFYGGAYRFFGGYYSLVPTITGDNDPVKSKEMFDKCVEVAPQYLETKVLYAEAYCTHGKVKNKELFKKLIDEVINADLQKYPEIMPENKIAQEKAKKLLLQETELFE